nr:hypothetical protein [Tanacetum cinerariifolium]
MDTIKNIVDLEAFREMLHISPRVPGQSFDKLPFEEEILDFLRFLGHNAQIKTLFDVNINKLFQPWRSFVAVINKCLTGKSSGFDSFSLSQAQILWGLYHKRNIDYAFLIWEDFVYQVEHKNQKKSNEMYYPRFTKVITHHFMMKKPLIPRRNKNTQQYGAILPIELTTEDIKNTKAYKEYYACATGEAAPKPKASARRKRGGSDSSTTPLTAIASPRPITTVAATSRLTAAAKRKQPARATSPTDPSEHGGFGKDEGTGSKPGVPDVPSDDSEKEISWNTSDDEDVDDQTKGRDDNEGEKTDESDADDDDQDETEKDDNDNNDDDKEEIAKLDEQEDTESGTDDAEETESDGESEEEETREEEEESFDLIPRTPEDDEDGGNGEEDQGLRISEEERIQEEEEANELYRDQESSSVSSFVTSMLNPTSDAGMESIFMTASSPIAPLPTPTPIMTPSTIATITTSSEAPIPPTTIPSTVLENLLTFDSVFHFEDRVKSLEVNFLEFMQTNQFAEAVSKIPDLIEMELKKILMEKMEGSKSIQRSDKQQNLYKALADAYEADKTILESYGDTAILKRRRGDDDDQEGPFAGSDWGSKRRREGGEPESASTPSEPATKNYGHIKWIDDLMPHTTWSQEPIVEWHNYKLLDWITVHRDDDKLYKFKEGDFKRLHIQDIEDMLLLLVQGKLTNMTVEECFAFNVSLRMFTRSIVIQRRMEDLQLGVKIYQKKLNLTRPDTYRSDMKHKEAYIAYSNPRGFIYQNKDKQNRLMRIDELHKFSAQGYSDEVSSSDYLEEK